MSIIIPIILTATIPLRNPFWPVGYEGVREAISDEPREVPQVQETTVTEADTQTSVTEEAKAKAEEEAELANNLAKKADRLWIKARKSLQIGKLTTRFNDRKCARQAVLINGNVYADGDYMSTNLDGKRFTWKVKMLTESGTLKLQRIKFRNLDEITNVKGE